MLTRSRGFNGSIQCQNIRLESNTVDDGGDLRNFLRTRGDSAHRFYYTGNRLPAIAGFNRSLLRQFAGMMRVIRILFHRRSELLHAGGSLFDSRRLFFGAR
ncbi:Uncharacterised protein [Shigella sonnei]|nr:Uncharacterised protein [Shigella sonnei]CSG24970.1 Uncharacterised protein [Shigella sonnei]